MFKLSFFLLSILLTLSISVNSFPQNIEVPVERQIFRACQDGSGGVCVENGKCPKEFLAPRNNNNQVACQESEECCFTVPSNNCRTQGGECVERESCGKAPVKNSNDCSNKQVCCIFL